MDRPERLWQQEEEELKAVLSSDLFARAPSLAILLEYICRKRFNGEDHLIKEYNIAVEALGRPADFDQKRDSIVRVEAHRLRKRLKQYYQREGASHEVEIEIPARGYSPVFRRRSDPAFASARNEDGEPAELADDQFLWDDSAAQIETDPFLPLDSAGSQPPVDQSPPAQTPPTWDRRTSVLRPRIAIGLSLLFVVALVIALAKWKGQPLPVPATSTESTAVAVSPTAAADSTSEIRIACGSTRQFADREGHVWEPDHFFVGGVAKDGGKRDIEGTLNPELFQSWREGAFTYKIPLKDGIYELTLAMAEPPAASGQPQPAETSRLFDVVLNGQVRLSEYDLFIDAGGVNVANWKVFKDIHPDETGHLVIELRNRVGGALLNGISVAPGSAGRLRPLRVGMRERPYTDSSGRLWVEDRYFSSGKLVKRIENVAGTDDPEIYRSERYGRLKYTIPVPSDSTYTLVLHFAETWFGGSGVGGTGSRLFDVLCNGKQLLSNFDVYKEAGGPFRAITRTFRGIRPRDNGKIVLELTPTRNYAMLNALEVLDESPAGESRPQPQQATRNQ